MILMGLIYMAITRSELAHVTLSFLEHFCLKYNDTFGRYISLFTLEDTTVARSF